MTIWRSPPERQIELTTQPWTIGFGDIFAERADRPAAGDLDSRTVQPVECVAILLGELDEFAQAVQREVTQG